MSREILNPVITLDLSIGPVTVRELSALDALELFEMVADDVLGVLRGLLPALQQARDEGKGEEILNMIMADATRVVRGSKKASVFLVERSTEGKPDLLKTIRASDFLKLFGAAFKLTFNEQLLAEGKELAGTIAAVLAPAMGAGSSPRPSTSS